jgi:hypothetical protein
MKKLIYFLVLFVLFSISTHGQSERYTPSFTCNLGCSIAPPYQANGDAPFAFQDSLIDIKWNGFPFMLYIPISWQPTDSFTWTATRPNPPGLGLYYMPDTMQVTDLTTNQTIQTFSYFTYADGPGTSSGTLTFTANLTLNNSAQPRATKTASTQLILPATGSQTAQVTMNPVGARGGCDRDCGQHKTKPQEVRLATFYSYALF